MKGHDNMPTPIKREGNLRPRLCYMSGVYTPTGSSTRRPLLLVLSRSRKGMTRVAIARSGGVVEETLWPSKQLVGLSDGQLATTSEGLLVSRLQAFVDAGYLRKSERRELLRHRKRLIAYAILRLERLHVIGRQARPWDNIGKGHSGFLHPQIVENARLFDTAQIDPHDTRVSTGKPVYTISRGYEHG